MNWIDPNKGKLDYVLASVPLISLLFVVFAYFHTVHPRFEQYDELEQAKAGLQSEKAKVAVLTEQLEGLQGAMEKSTARKNYVEQLYLSIADPRARLEYLTNSDKLYFSKSEVISEYRAYTEQMIKESGEPIDLLSIIALEVAVSNAEQSDLLLVDEKACGSSGCMGPLFISQNDAYCFSSWAHTQTIDNFDGTLDLKCHTFSDTNRRYLSDTIDGQASSD